MVEDFNFLKSDKRDYDAYLDLALSSENDAIKSAMEQASEPLPKEN